MVAMLIKNGTVQQKSTVTLTLIHAASTPLCIDCTHSAALNIVKCISNIHLHRSSKMIGVHLAKPLKAWFGN